MQKIKWNIILGILVTFVFFSLLLIRLELFRNNHEPVTNMQITKLQEPQDIWMNIFQNNKKIGFVHRTFSKRNNQYYFNEKVIMEINTMGVTQALNISTEGELNPDMTLSSFNFNLNSSIFSFNAHGYVSKNKLILFTGLPNAQEKSELPLKEIPHISGSIYDAAFHNKLGNDATRNFSVFDPSTMSIQPIKVTRNADEIIPIMGKRILTKKYCADFMGAKNCAWLDKDGNVLKETGILGLSMEKTIRNKALEGIDRGASFDITQIASIPSNIEINEAQNLSQIKIKIKGINNELFLDGDRQSYHNNILTITRENIQSTSHIEKNLPAEISLYLKPSPLIQSNNPQIKTQAEKIIKPTDSTEKKARKIIDWVYRNLEKKPTLSVPNALEVLKNKSGDCNEHTVLTVALLRAAGIPAQSEAGLVYLRGRFYYHAWCVFYLDKWITADAVFNQLPADVTHIRLIRGESDKQISLMGVIGKIKLEVMEQRR